MFFSSSLKSSAVNFIQDLLRRSPEARRYANFLFILIKEHLPRLDSATSQAPWVTVLLCPSTLLMLHQRLAESPAGCTLEPLQCYCTCRGSCIAVRPLPLQHPVLSAGSSRYESRWRQLLLINFRDA